MEAAAKPPSGLIFALSLDGAGLGTPLSWNDVTDWDPSRGPVWVHLDRTSKTAQNWLAGRPGMEPTIFEALTDEDPRPRALVLGGRALIVLRGVNLNPGAHPEDMVSLRLWVEAGMVVTLRARRLKAVEDVRERLAKAVGPRTPGEVVPAISGAIIDRALPVVDGLETHMDALEAESAGGDSARVPGKIADLRRAAVRLRRYFGPQREALSRLVAEAPTWLSEGDRARLREDLDQVTRLVEDLDLVRERAAVMQEEIAAHAAALVGRRTYVLSLVALIFLPLTALCGLLGVNVGGVPLRNEPWAFWALCIAMAGLAAGLYGLFKKRRWL